MVAGMEYDYLSVDDLISITVNPDFGTGIPQDINNVCRGTVTTREAAASHGAVQAGDAMFIISELEMQESLPNIGANLNPHDEPGVWYTVLHVMKDRDSRVWHCMARDLSLALNLSAVASQERRQEEQADDGSTVFTWQEIASDLPTRVQPMSAMMKTEYGVEELDVSHVLYFTNTLDTSETDRFVVDDRYYYVRGWKQAESLGQPFIVIAEEGEASGSPFSRSSGGDGSSGTGSPGSGRIHRKGSSSPRGDSPGKSVGRRRSGSNG